MKPDLVGKYVPPALGWVTLLLLVSICAYQVGGAEPAKPISAEIADALKSLKTADAAGRQKVYDLLAAKGDARLIPAIKAYKDGSLQIRDERLVMFGERVKLPDQDKSVLPLIDALTGQQVNDKDGKPVYFPKPDLSKAIKSPPRLEKAGALTDLLAALSLLDPDPVARTASIRDAAEHAARSIPDPQDSQTYLDALAKCATVLNAHSAKGSGASESSSLRETVTAIAAATAEHPKRLISPAPSELATSTVKASLRSAQDSVKDTGDATLTDSIAECITATSAYQDRLDQRKKVLEELPKTDAALKRQLEKEPNSRFASALKEAIASTDLCIGDEPARISAAGALGKIGTSRAANLLGKALEAANRAGDIPTRDAIAKALSAANTYQTEVHIAQTTFAGLSAGSILVLMALGLSIIFGLMGVINMAQGEFMMLGAFITYLVAEGFKHFGPAAYEYYLLAAVPAAFLGAGIIGYVVELTVIRHLYGRPLETLLATWGIGYILIWGVRKEFGDNVSVAPPRWMEGGWEVAPDMIFPLNRLYIILFCAICIAVVYFVVNGTKLGLLLRATTQNREMANVLGVPTRRVDGMTFAFGAGLAGLAGVAVPLYNKINPNIGQEYIVDCFMVVVVGGVGKLAGAVWAGLGLGFIGKYLETLLGSIPSLASGSSVVGKVLVLLLIIIFLQWRPQGLFPPKGRNADA